MELVTDTVSHLWDFYNWTFTIADPRVENWFLMSGFAPTACLSLTYLAFVWLVPKIMANKEPFQFRWTLFFYNMGLVVLNFHIFWELLTASYKLNYSLKCQLVHQGDDPDELRIAKAIWWYYFSKCLEFFDTIFFILRKKNSQVSFLHVYHHTSMFPIWFIGVRWVPGGQAFFGAMINSFIHVVMYTYYGIAALGPQYQKYLWWKRYLTIMQLIQFIIGMLHAATSLYVQCPFPLWMQYALIIYGFTILGLFLNFYYQSYIIKARKAKQAREQKAANGTTPINGYIANGHTSNGTSEANGTLEGKKSR